MKVQVLGIGCARCQELQRRVIDTLAELDIAAEVEHVTDLRRFAAVGVLMTPGLVVDGKVVCQGRVPTKPEIATWLSGQR